jgi:hypothetical protein
MADPKPVTDDPLSPAAKEPAEGPRGPSDPPAPKGPPGHLGPGGDPAEGK